MFRNEYKIIKKSGLFDEKYYLKTYKDIRILDLDPIKHYVKFGWKEGRNPSEKFDTDSYINMHIDLKDKNICPLSHFIKYGNVKSIKRFNSKIEKIISLLNHTKNNPKLIKRTIEDIKLIGIKKTILKIKNKYTKIEESFVIREKIGDFDKVKVLLNEEAIIPEFNTQKPIDIIIPVYNGYEFLKPLINSVVRNTYMDYRILICDDKSSDEKVLPLLKELKYENSSVEIILFENEQNLGFIKTVNKLVKFTENHFVLLNTDTEVPPFWIERLMYPIFEMENIASTTPFTNAGTICSFPNYLEDNLIFEDMNVEELDSYFQYVNFEKTYIEIPTGIGFCMGVNKDLVDKIGMFDEIFGKGYSEENDWCQRAISEGYKNLHVTNLFVYHKHGGSFPSEEKKFLMENNLKLLSNRYPNYLNEVQSLVEKNELDYLRSFLINKISLNNKIKDSNTCFYCGYLSASSGVGNASRSYMKLLGNLGLNVEKFDLVSNQNWFLDLMNTVFEKTPKFIVFHVNADMLLHFSELNTKNLQYLKKNFYLIGAWAWESDLPSDDFFPASKFLDEIWSISNYMDKSLKDLSIKTNVIPLVVEKYPFESIETESEIINRINNIKKRFEFIIGYFFDLRSYSFRKNPEGVIEVFKSIFENKNVALILKISGKNEYPEDYKRILELCKNNSEQIFIFNENWSEYELMYTYKTIDVYLALFRVEGFGYTIAEAMLYGKPTLCINFSGVNDFALDDDRVNIKYNMFKLSKEWGPYKKGLVWAEPDLDDAKNKLINLFNDKKLRDEIGKSSSKRIESTLSIECLSDKMKKVIDQIEFKKN